MVLYVSSETKAMELALLYLLHAAHMLSSDSLSSSCSYGTVCVLGDQKQWSLGYFIGYLLHTCCLQIPPAIPAHMVLYVSSETKAMELGLLYWLHAAHMLSSDSPSNSCSYGTVCVL
jgi:hypothetical protein